MALSRARQNADIEDPARYERLTEGFARQRVSNSSRQPT
jgi:hypothetical protein